MVSSSTHRGFKTPCSFAVEAPTVQRQLPLFLCHGPDRSMALKQAPKLHTDVKCPRPITILNQLAFLVLANAQAANLSSVPSPHRRMRTALSHASAARLRRVLLWRDRHHEPFGQLSHQFATKANTRSIPAEFAHHCTTLRSMCTSLTVKDRPGPIAHCTG